MLAAKSSIAQAENTVAEDGLPLPTRPATGPGRSAPRGCRLFLRSGRHNADLIRDVLRDDGSTIEELEVLLDWGCGCGRVLRHWVRTAATPASSAATSPRRWSSGATTTSRSRRQR